MLAGRAEIVVVSVFEFWLTKESNCEAEPNGWASPQNYWPLQGTKLGESAGLAKLSALFTTGIVGFEGITVIVGVGLGKVVELPPWLRKPMREIWQNDPNKSSAKIAKILDFIIILLNIF